MEIPPRVKVGLALILFLIIYYVLTEIFFRIDFGGYGATHPLILTQTIYGLFSCFFMMVLPGKFTDYGFKITPFNYRKILLIIFFIQLLPLVSIFTLIFTKSVELFSWMHLSLFELFFSYLVLSPIAEEIFFRGLILGLLAPLRVYKIRISGVGLSAPVIISSILFALMHVDFFLHWLQPASAIKTIISMTLLGLVCGYYCEKHSSLVPAIYAHTLFNFLGVFLFKIGLIFLY